MSEPQFSQVSNGEVGRLTFPICIGGGGLEIPCRKALSSTAHSRCSLQVTMTVLYVSMPVANKVTAGCIWPACVFCSVH